MPSDAIQVLGEEVKMDDVMVVVRSSSERTEPLCSLVLKQRFGKENVELVRQSPFEVALSACYEIGMNSDAKWMVAVDADLIVDVDKISQLILIAEQKPSNFFQFQGRIYDFLFSVLKKGGVRLYRTSLLKKAVAYVPSPNCSLRPESLVNSTMADLGYESSYLDVVTGIHDFEQYYRDLYRKAYLHGKKHPYLADKLINRCFGTRELSPESQIIFKGFCDGIVDQKPAVLDSTHYLGLAQKTMEELEISEKKPLDAEDITLNFAASLLSKLPPSARYVGSDQMSHGPAGANSRKLVQIVKDLASIMFARK